MAETPRVHRLAVVVPVVDRPRVVAPPRHTAPQVGISSAAARRSSTRVRL
jgi:hypothetical protein